MLTELANGFRLIPVLLDAPLTFPGYPAAASRHHLLVKRNQTKANAEEDASSNDSHLPNDRTLFVVNTPAITPIRALRKAFQDLFRKCGTVERVQIKHKRVQEQFSIHHVDNALDGEEEDESAQHPDTLSGEFLPLGSFVYVVFSQPEALDRVMQMKPNKKRQWIGIPAATDAPQRWRRRAQAELVTDRQAYQQELDTWLAQFDAEEERKQRELEERHNQPDEDGWVTVTRRANRRNKTTAGEISVLAAKPADVQKLKPKEKKVVDFYRFQLREAKRDKLTELRKKFEQDKEKIARLQANRRFKPY